MRCPIKKLDRDTCTDFSTKGTLVSDKFREGWEKAFGAKIEVRGIDENHVEITETINGSLYPPRQPSSDERS